LSLQRRLSKILFGYRQFYIWRVGSRCRDSALRKGEHHIGAISKIGAQRITGERKLGARLRLIFCESSFAALREIGYNDFVIIVELPPDPADPDAVARHSVQYLAKMVNVLKWMGVFSINKTILDQRARWKPSTCQLSFFCRHGNHAPVVTDRHFKIA